MPFRITGLSPDPFRALFGLPDDALAARGARRCVADAAPGYPDRISLTDAAVGERLILLNYTHQSADTPYRASHAIFVREGARVAFDRVDEIPPALASRTLSLRAFDAAHEMIDADLAQGEDAIAAEIARQLANPAVIYIHAHFARRGCYAARIDRA